MATATDKLFEAALHLSPQERSDLAALLLESLEGSEPDPEVEEAWLLEAERRARELESGVVTAIPWSEVRARLYRITGG